MGGPGASPQTSIKFAGLPWEIGLSEVHQIFSQDSILEKRKHNQNWLIYHNPVLPELNDKLSRVII